MSEDRPGTLEWYVVHTYSGYENKVKDNLEKAVENNGMQDLIKDVRVPVEEVVEIKNGKRKISQRKTFPGYVLVRMIITNESWYVVRNTRGVTGFVGPESKPVPLTPAELDVMLNNPISRVDYKIAVGEEVRILSGPLENFTGTVEEIDTAREKMTVRVKMFLGREMQFSQEVRVRPRREGGPELFKQCFRQGGCRGIGNNLFVKRHQPRLASLLKEARQQVWRHFPLRAADTVEISMGAFVHEKAPGDVDPDDRGVDALGVGEVELSDQRCDWWLDGIVADVAQPSLGDVELAGFNAFHLFCLVVHAEYE